MAAVDRKALLREYKAARRPAGVYQVRNTVTGRIYAGITPDLPGMLNRQGFQLEMGSHPDKTLQADWNELGAGAFEIGVLEELEQPEDPGYDPAEDLGALFELWIERFEADGTPLYPMVLRGRAR